MPKLTLVLYTRPDCHLCDDAKEALSLLQRRARFEVDECNVDEDPALAERYGDEVPVGVVDGHKLFKYRVDSERLLRALRARGA